MEVKEEEVGVRTKVRGGLDKSERVKVNGGRVRIKKEKIYIKLKEGKNKRSNYFTCSIRKFGQVLPLTLLYLEYKPTLIIWAGKRDSYDRCSASPHLRTN